MVLADLDFDLDFDPDLTDVLFLELSGDLLTPPKTFLLVDLTLTLCDDSAEVIKSARCLDLAFSAIFVR